MTSSTEAAGPGVPLSGLLTDLYELKMAASYLKRRMTASATFSLFARKLPLQRGYLVAAGIGPLLADLEGYGFREDDLAFLREELGFQPDAVERLRGLRFTGDVWAVPEGEVVHGGEPLLEISAPLPEAQLVETIALNRLSFETSVATKAARCVTAAAGRDVVDFSFRRTQGIDAALAVARASAIAGFTGTSNVEAARRFGLRAVGTMAHSYIEAFGSEAEAFSAFADDFPGAVTFLVDTFSTLEGIEVAIVVIRSLPSTVPCAIRLDSGNLDELARAARWRLDMAGLGRVRVMASGSLDEFELDRLVTAGAPIDSFGVGTKMGVSADQPYLDSAYKLVEYAGRPVMKLSAGKVNMPGRKQVFRPLSGGRDVIGTRDEPVPPGHRPILEPMMLGGRRTPASRGIDAARARLERARRLMSVQTLRIVDPVAVEPQLSARAAELVVRTRRELLARLP